MANGKPSLDRADKSLLRVLQENCALSAEEIAQRCAMSASTALRRIKRLRATRVIRREIAVIDPIKVGRPLSMIVGVRLERDDTQIVRSFLDKIRSNPAVMQCYFVTGSVDYILHLSARDMGEYDEFIQELVRDPHIAMSETHVVIKPIKVSLAVPIE